MTYESLRSVPMHGIIAIQKWENGIVIGGNDRSIYVAMLNEVQKKGQSNLCLLLAAILFDSQIEL